MTNSMHVRFEKSEAINSRKLLLEAQIDLLKIVQNIRAYRISRKQQALLKTKLKTKLSTISSEISKINAEMPAVDKRYIHEEKKEKQVKEKVSVKPKDTKDKSLEQELDSIKRKLSQLR